MPSARLVTIPFSHYCEKARWALDRAGFRYREEPHLPMLAWGAAFRAGGKRTVPILVTDGEALTDSHEIVRFAAARAPDANLYPDDIARDVEAFERLLDRKLGPATRRIAYSLLLPARGALEDLFSKRGPAWEIRAARVGLPLMRRVIKKGLRIDEEGVARSEHALLEVLSSVEERLADGRTWLFGDRFTAADLTFAALSTPLLAPAQVGEHIGSLETMPTVMRERIDRFRATPGGQLALRAYDAER